MILLLAPGDIELASWPLEGEGRPDLAAVDTVARLALAARRRGWSIRLQDVCAELEELLDLVGLRLEVVRQAEGGEEVGVEEVVMADDPVA